MKTKNLLLGALTCLAFTACSSDEEAVVDNVIQDGEKAYLAVTLVNNNNSNTRGTSGGFSEATLESEGAINTVAFLFYNASGAPVAAQGDNADFFYQVSELNGDDGNFFTANNTSASNDNVETIGSVKIAFENLNSNASPRSVLALLNITEAQYNALKSKNLSETTNGALQAILTGDATATDDARKKSGETTWCNEFTVDSSKKNYFIMTNSSYNDGTNVIQATPITAANFIDQAEENAEAIAAKAVEIYVERMAAKVEVTRATSVTNTIKNDVETGDGTVSEQTLTVEILGWGLNAVNDDAYWFKNITGINIGTDNFTWNAPNNFRSYWAVDNDYSNGTYPTSYGLGDQGYNNLTTGTNATGVDLIYKSSEALTYGVTSNNVAYCHENTLDASANETVAATSVLVLAQFKVGETEPAKNSVLYSYNGVLYDANNYKAAATEMLDSKLTGIYIKTVTDGETSFTDLSTDDLELEELTDGYVAYKLTSTAEAKTFTKNAEATATDNEWDATQLAAKIKETTRANGYTENKMYYSIPLQHLGKTGQLGEYGVVRNHWYKLEIGSVLGLGKGIYKPDEIIVPNTDETKFKLATKLNVLSWHVVNQSADLQ